MKVVRILQVILLILLAGYLLLVHNLNPQTVLMPFLLPLPTALVMLIALLLGWLIAWIPDQVRLWQLKRNKNRLQKRVEELETTLGYRVEEPSAPVIPDRDAASKSARRAKTEQR